MKANAAMEKLVLRFEMDRDASIVRHDERQTALLVVPPKRRITIRPIRLFRVRRSPWPAIDRSRQPLQDILDIRRF
jgi:hypothetical protein